jgi:hypothetical protein
MPDWNMLIKEGSILIGFIAAALLIREVLSFVRPLLEKRAAVKRAANGEGEPEAEEIHRCIPADVDMREIYHWLKDLYAWHSVEDDDHVKVWYIRKSFYTMIEQLAKANDNIASSLQELVATERQLCARLDSVERATDRLTDKVTPRKVEPK